MIIKVIGAILIIAACGGFGFKLVYIQLQEEKMLREIIRAVAYMICELQYHLTPLPQLCYKTSLECGGAISSLFAQLSSELKSQILPDADRCMQVSLDKHKDFPKKTQKALLMLGKSLGRFDLEGQVTGLQRVQQDCQEDLAKLTDNRDSRLRGYQTLALCAGAALVILFI